MDLERPTTDPAPVVVHVPHASTWIPPDVRTDLEVGDDRLASELLRLTDHRTDVLTDGVVRCGASRIVNRVSRLVVDPERLPDDREELAARGMGAVYTHGADGRRLRRPDGAAFEDLLARFHRPYAAAVAALVGEVVEDHGRCTIVDVHSYPTRQLPYELHDGPRPPLCIGTDPLHTPPWLRHTITDVARTHGIEVGFDTPFAGTYVPLDRFGTDPRVTSVMLELRRDGYLDEDTAQPHAGEPAIRAFVEDAVAAVADHQGAAR
jgi:N-formylglutamate deformylase